jgi:hypothetical protein
MTNKEHRGLVKMGDTTGIFEVKVKVKWCDLHGHSWCETCCHAHRLLVGYVVALLQTTFYITASLYCYFEFTVLKGATVLCLRFIFCMLWYLVGPPTDPEVLGSIPGTPRFFWVVVGLEWGPLSLVSRTEELHGRIGSGSGLENREYGLRDPLCWQCKTFYLQKLALTSSTSGCRSQTKATEQRSLLFVLWYLVVPMDDGW